MESKCAAELFEVLCDRSLCRLSFISKFLKFEACP